MSDNCELSDRDSRQLDVTDLAAIENSDLHDFYARQLNKNSTARALCVDGINFCN